MPGEELSTPCTVLYKWGEFLVDHTEFKAVELTEEWLNRLKGNVCYIIHQDPKQYPYALLFMGDDWLEAADLGVFTETTKGLDGWKRISSAFYGVRRGVTIADEDWGDNSKLPAGLNVKWLNLPEGHSDDLDVVAEALRGVTLPVEESKLPSKTHSLESDRVVADLTSPEVEQAFHDTYFEKDLTEYWL